MIANKVKNKNGIAHGNFDCIDMKMPSERTSALQKIAKRLH